MNNVKRIKIGEAIPDFSLKDQNNTPVRISDYRGKKVLLSFHPLAWTSICAKQMKSLEDYRTRLEGFNAVAMGVSVDSVPSKKAWAEKELKITKTRLLADFWPHGNVAKQCGIFRTEDGFSERAHIIIDEQQKVIFVKIYEISTLPDMEEILRVLEDQGGT